MSSYRLALYRAALRLKKANYWLVAQLVSGMFWLLRRLPADSAIDLADRLGRFAGPLSGRHRLAIDNLRQAFPEKTDDEIERIAREMWGHMGRLMGEYLFIDTLSKFELEAGSDQRVEIAGLDLAKSIRDEGDRPRIFFTAHTGNFEMVPVAAAIHGIRPTVLYRAPNNPYLAERILAIRGGSMGNLLASRPGAALTLARLLDSGKSVGMLVDQKFHGGVRSRFFGRECLTSPLVPKLAAQTECDIYPCRCVRLPGNRYRIEIEDRMELPRNATGKVDVAASVQAINDVVERWVREHPEQWMWIHRRWQIPG